MQTKTGLEVSPADHARHAKYERLIEAARAVPPATTLVVHPCDETSLRGATEAAEAGIIHPILIGPIAKVTAAAREHEVDISRIELIDAPHSEAAAAKAVELVRQGKAEFLMKGSLHTDELLAAVVARETAAAHRTPHQSRIHHGRADLPQNPVCHRRRD